MESYRCGEFHLDVTNRRFSRDGVEIALEPKLFAVLQLLVARPDQLVTRNELLDSVWGHRYVTPSTLNRLIALARRAFGDDVDQPRFIQTVHGAGYRYIGPAEPQQASAPVQPMRFAPPSGVRLPARIEALIGREQELAALADRVRQHRAVTVIGTGGMGKTQCALECARRMAEQFPDGVWFFDLAPMQGGEEWLRALGAAVGIPPAAAPELVDSIAQVLQDRRMLVVIDNCDRIAADVGRMAVAILRGAGLVRILATSQAPLNFAGEQLMRLPPLALPQESDTPRSVAELAAAPAVAMLLARVRAVQPHFAFDADVAPAIVAICRRLDGMPLALELAAARFALLSPAQVLQRLERRFQFLNTQATGRDPRHRTLLALLEWSFALLVPEEQRLLAWLSVFVQGWSVEAVMELAAPLGREPESVVEMLGGLVDKSLVAMEPELNPPRYHLLETVREYALDRLRAAGEEGRARDAQLAFVVAMCRAGHRDILEGRMQQRVDQMLYELGNVGAAIEFAAGRECTRNDGLAIIGSLLLYMKARGPLDRGPDWCRKALAGTGHLETAERGRALLCQGVLAWHMRDPRERPEDYLAEAARLADEHGDDWAEAVACGYLAMWCANDGRIAEAGTVLQVTRRLAAHLDDDFLRGLDGLAQGWIHLAQGDGAAAALSLRAARDLGHDQHQRHYIRTYVGLVLIGLGQYAAAAAELSDALEAAIRLGNVRGAAASMECCGYIEKKLGQPRDAARFLGAARAVRERTGIPLFNFWLPLHEAAHAALRMTLGAADYEDSLQAGMRMRTEDAASKAYTRLRAYAGQCR